MFVHAKVKKMKHGTNIKRILVQADIISCSLTALLMA
jgi:hypothetical protein